MEQMSVLLQLNFMNNDQSLQNSVYKRIHELSIHSVQGGESTMKAWKIKLNELPKPLMKNILSDFEQLFCNHVIDEVNAELEDGFPKSVLEKYVYLIRQILHLKGVPCSLSFKDHITQFPNKKPFEW